MALTFIGQSECPICGKIFLKEDDIIGLPLVVNSTHPLFEFFDRGIHKSCFEKWEKKKEVLKIILEEKKKFENSDYYQELVTKYGKSQNS